MEHTAIGARAEEVILLLLYQLIAILGVTRIIVLISRRFLGQTDVTGEILAGLLLGPSLLGALAPDLLNGLFHPSTSTIFVGLAQVGLIFLMFQIGQEFEFQTNIAGSKRAVIAISLTGIVVPFFLGYLTASWFYSRMVEPLPPEFGFRIFFATAMSITAIPVLGRIFMELGLSHTRTATLTIAAAAIDDVVGWLLLGVTSSIVAANFSVWPFFIRIAAIAAYIGLVFILIRPLLLRLVDAHLERNGRLTQKAIALLLLALFLSASITSHLGIFAIIGGFVLGVALHENRRFVTEWKTRISPLVNTFFLPIFFTYTGLRTDIGLLTTSDAVIECLLVCAVAFIGKFGGAFVAASLTGSPRKSALTIGISMNTRGLMELIAINVGYDLGVLPPQMFTILVIMALVSTYIATPLIAWLLADERKEAQTI